jgi:hypothetical protein
MHVVLPAPDGSTADTTEHGGSTADQASASCLTAQWCELSVEKDSQDLQLPAARHSCSALLTFSQLCELLLLADGQLVAEPLQPYSQYIFICHACLRNNTMTL